MAAIFCCSQVQPYRPKYLDHEQKFRDVMDWASFPRTSSAQNNTGDANIVSERNPSYAVQIVRQVNYGPLESKRYFIAVIEKADEPFLEVTERDLIKANYEKLNSYKNFKCDAHNKFFEVNLYQKNPINKHHWRADIARPAEEIDV